MFGMMEGASFEVDLDKPLTEETKNMARASMRAQLEAKGVTRERIEVAVAKLDELFDNWSPTGFLATSFEQMATMIESRVTFARGAMRAIEQMAMGGAQRGAPAKTVYEMGCVSTCMNTAAMMMDVAATRMRELAAEVRDEKPEAVGEA